MPPTSNQNTKLAEFKVYIHNAIILKELGTPEKQEESDVQMLQNLYMESVSDPTQFNPPFCFPQLGILAGLVVYRSQNQKPTNVV